MTDTILNIIFNGFFVTAFIFTAIFTVMLCVEEFRND